MNKRKKSILIFAVITCLGACDGLGILDEQGFFVEKYDLATDIVSPGINKYTYSARPEIKWLESDNIISYDFQLSASESFGTSLLADISESTAGSYTLSRDLPDYGRYYWRIRMTMTDGTVTSWFNYAFAYLDESTFEHFEDFEEDGFSTQHSWSLSGDTLPFITDSTAYDGFHSVKFNEDEAGDSVDNKLSLDFTTDEYGFFSFYYKNIGEDSSLYFYPGNYTDSITVNEEITEWTRYMVYIEPDDYYFYWNYEQSWNAEAGNAYLDCIRLDPVEGLNDDDFETNDGKMSTLNNWLIDGDVLPHITSSEKYDGNYSVELGDPDNWGETNLKTIADFEEDSILGFCIKNSNSSDSFYFDLDGSTMYSLNETLSDWTMVYVYITAGRHSLDWSYNDYSSVSDAKVWIDSISVIPVPGFIDDSFENSGSVLSSDNRWTIGGDGLPFLQAAEASDGTQSVEFGDIGSYDQCWFELLADFSADGTIYFDTLKGGTSGRLYLYIDGSQEIYISTSYSSWTTLNTAVTAGVHTVKWRYYSYSSNPEDCYIDNIRYVPD